MPDPIYCDFVVVIPLHTLWGFSTKEKPLSGVLLKALHTELVTQDD